MLCYLEGKSRDETAQQLGVSTDVLRGRLARGRDRLRRRLTRRGIALSAGLLAMVASCASAGSLSSKLVQATLMAATSQPTATVTTLLHGTSFALGVAKIKLVDLALVFASLLVAAGVVRVCCSGGANAPSAPPVADAVKAEPTAVVADKPNPGNAQMNYTGRVTDRVTGKPISGWIEYRPLADNPHADANPLRAPLDQDGRFSIPAPAGTGVLIVKADGAFLPAKVDEADRLPGVFDPHDAELLATRPSTVSGVAVSLLPRRSGQCMCLC